MANSISANSDAELLRRYAGERSDEAFAEIVRRHINLVYSTSLRRLGDGHLAEDVTQTVFFVLAKKAGKISRSTILAGWLYQTARFISADAIKMKMRRQQHEQAAARLRAESIADETWPRISPLLESAMDGLGSLDRDVILLRFFEGLEIGEIATAAGVSANTVSKRLQRAIERLRKYFSERGIATPASALGPAIAAGATHSAPAALTAACVGQSSGASTVSLTLAKGAMSAGSIWLKAIAGVLLGVVAIGTAIVATYLLSSSPPASAPPPSAAAAPATAPSLTGELQPVSAKQEQQVRAAIYTLRYYTIGIRNDKWTNAMRTLVEIGRPAVPELVAELDRTSNDRTLRALAFTLRAIGDPRACPALIRAINRTVPLSSDFFFRVSDPAASDFMHAHELDHNPSAIMYERAVREICGTLTTITHHKEGRPAFVDARSNTPVEIKRSKHLHEALTQQWMSWWETHGRDIVSNADLATLTAQPHDADDIEAAGLAAHGPLFPTGAPHHLGVVHDIVLRGGDEQLDTSEILDFDAEQKMTSIELMRRVPPPPQPSLDDSSRWFIGVADALCYEQFSRIMKPAPRNKSLNAAQQFQQSILGAIPDPQSRYYWLFPVDDSVWPVDNSRWDTLAHEIESGQVIVSRPGESDFSEDKDGQPLNGKFPATFLFRTHKGGAGIVQLIGSDEARQGVHIRYRMVEPPPSGVELPPARPLPDSAGFGPVRQIMLEGLRGRAVCAMNLETGQTITTPDDPNLIKHYDQWMESTHANLIAGAYSTGNKPAGLVFRKMKAFALLSTGAFDSLTPGMAELTTHYMTVPQSCFLGLPDQAVSPDTGIFSTQSGTIGMIQIVSITDNPPTVTLRYKVIQQPSKR